MSEDEEVEEGTPEFEIAAMEGLMYNGALSWYDRLRCAKKAIDGLHELLDAANARAEEAERGIAYLEDLYKEPPR